MKTIFCKACRKGIAASAEVCPHCGQRRTRPEAVVVVLILAAGLAWMFSLYLRH